MWVAQADEVIPVFLVESGQWRKSEDRLLILDGVGGSCEVVELVVDDRGRYCVPIF